MTSSLDTRRLGSIPDRVPAVRGVVVRDRTGSTNDDARRLAAEGAAAWTVVVAGCQTAGRGRVGRSWHSPAGVGIYVSVLLRPRRPAPEIARWTLAAAAAAAEACARTGAQGLSIKWPNDLLASGRKIAGILAELRTSASGEHDLVVGAGFNVLHRPDDFPEELRATAGSLRMAGADRGTTREEIAESWLARFADLEPSLELGVWEPVAARWTAWASGAEGRSVRVLPGLAGGEVRTGVTQGLDAFGALRVATAGGAMLVVRFADSVVPLEE